MGYNEYLMDKACEDLDKERELQEEAELMEDLENKSMAQLAKQCNVEF